MSEQAVNALVDRAREGDADAFGLLHDRFQPEILRYLTHQIRNPETAEDLAQQVFLKAWQAIPRYEQRGTPFKAWLYRMARNQVIDQYREHRKVLVQRFLMEKSAAEISEAMDRKEVTVRGLQMRALRALRKELEAIGGMP